MQSGNAIVIAIFSHISARGVAPGYITTPLWGFKTFKNLMFYAIGKRYNSFSAVTRTRARFALHSTNRFPECKVNLHEKWLFSD